MAGGACTNRPRLCPGDEASIGTFGLRRRTWRGLSPLFPCKGEPPFLVELSPPSEDDPGGGEAIQVDGCSWGVVTKCNAGRYGRTRAAIWLQEACLAVVAAGVGSVWQRVDACVPAFGRAPAVVPVRQLVCFVVESLSAAAWSGPRAWRSVSCCLCAPACVRPMTQLAVCCCVCACAWSCACGGYRARGRLGLVRGLRVPPSFSFSCHGEMLLGRARPAAPRRAKTNTGRVWRCPPPRPHGPAVNCHRSHGCLSHGGSLGLSCGAVCRSGRQRPVCARNQTRLGTVEVCSGLPCLRRHPQKLSGPSATMPPPTPFPLPLTDATSTAATTSAAPVSLCCRILCNCRLRHHSHHRHRPSLQQPLLFAPAAKPITTHASCRPQRRL